MRFISKAALSAALVFALNAQLSAQDYPNRPIRVVTSQGAGGISDIFIRALGEEMHKALGQPFVIENRTGANGNIGARACADAPNDGYTICILPSEPLTYNHLIMKGTGFDPETGLTPITNFFFITQVLAASSSLNVKTLSELAAVSKAKPGTLSYTTPGMATSVFMENFYRENGADLVRVPFKGGGDAITRMLNGTVPVGFFGLANFIPYLQNGSLVGLAVDTDSRSAMFPNIPTLREQKYTGPLTVGYFGLLAPAGTPKPIVDKLYSTIHKVASEPTFKAKNMVDRGHEPILNTPEQFADFLKKDRQTAREVVKAAGVEAPK